MADAGPLPAAALTAELHLKMSKKVAQLTKVIFHLNTRNEDFQLELARARAAHTDESQRLAADAAAKLRQLQDDGSRAVAAERAKQRELEQALEAAGRHRETEKRRADALLTRLNESERGFQTAVEALEMRVSSAKEAFERRLREVQSGSEQDEQRVRGMEKQMETARAEWEAQTLALRQKHALEAQRMAADSQLKREEMFTSHRQETERLEQRIEAEQQQRQKLQQQLGAQEERLKQQEQQLKLQLAQLEARQSNALKAEQEAHASTTRELLSKMEGLLSESEALRATEVALRRDKEALTRDKLALDKDKRVLELQLVSAQEEAQSVRRDADANGDKLRELLALSTDKIDQLARELAELRTALQDKEQQVDEASKQLEVAREEIHRRAANESETEAKLQQTVREREREIAAAKAELLRVNHQAASAEAANDKRVRSLEESAVVAADQARSKIEEQAKLISELSAELVSVKQRLSESESRLAKTLEELAHEKHCLELELNKTQQQLASMGEQQRQLELQAREAVESASVSASVTLNVQLTALKTQHDAELKDKQRELSDRLREAELKYAQQLAAELERVRRDAKADTDKQLQVLKQQLTATIETNRLTHEKATQQLRREHDEALRKLQATLASQREAGNKQLVEREAHAQQQMQQELAELKKQHEASVQTLEMQWREQLEQQVGDLRADYEARLEQLADEVNRTRAHAESSRLEADEALRVLRERNGLTFEQLRSATIAFAHRMEAEHSSLSQRAVREMSEANARHNDALKTQEEHMRAEAQRLLDRLQEETTRERVDLTNKHARDLEALRGDHESRLRELRASLEGDKNAALLAARAEFAKQKSDLNAEKERERRKALDKLQGEHALEVGAVTTRLEESTATLARVSSDLTLAQREVKRMYGVMDAKTRETDERVAALEAAARNEMETLKRAAKRDMDKLLEENLAETKLLSDEFEETRCVMTDKCVALAAAVQAWEDRYLRRESREEDVARIAELARAVAERDALVKRTLDEMAYFKREMLNREETYNKTFARAPNVGVLQVLKPHVQLQAQLQASSSSNNNNNSMNGAPIATPPHTKRKTKPARGAAGGGAEPELQRRHSVAASTSTGSSASARGLPPLGSNQNQAMS